MPRKARIDAPGAVHHIIVRGIERGEIFHDDQDRNQFVKRLGAIVMETKTRCFACGGQWGRPLHIYIYKTTDMR